MKLYLFKGFVCPFCGRKKNFLLAIREDRCMETGKLHGHKSYFMCTDHLTMDENISKECNHSVNIGWYGFGIPLKNIIKDAIEDYKGWKCNKKR